MPGLDEMVTGETVLYGGSSPREFRCTQRRRQKGNSPSQVEGTRAPHHLSPG